MTWRNKSFVGLMYGAVGIVILTAVLLAFWLVQPSDVLVLNNAPFPTRTVREAAQPEGVVILKVDYCKKVQTDGRVRASFASTSREVFLPVSKERQAIGCYQTELPVIVPKGLEPDRYRVNFIVDYQVNPIKPVREEFSSQEFIVVK